jgi:hypothetical protein
LDIVVYVIVVYYGASSLVREGLAEGGPYRAYRGFLLELWTAWVRFVLNVLRSDELQRLGFVDGLVYIGTVESAFSVEAIRARMGRWLLSEHEP